MTGLIERCEKEEGLLAEVQACLNSKGFQLLMEEARFVARPRAVICQVGADAIGLSALQQKEDFGRNAILTFMETFPQRFIEAVNRKEQDDSGDHFGASEIQGRQDPFAGQRKRTKRTK